MRKFALFAAVLLFSTHAIAAQGEVCASQAKPLAGPLTNDLVFVCPKAGSHTIPELYAQGWRVVSVFSQMAPGDKSSPVMTSQWAVVIEKL